MTNEAKNGNFAKPMLAPVKIRNYGSNELFKKRV